MKKAILAGAFASIFSFGAGTAWSAEVGLLVDDGKVLSDSKMEDLRGSGFSLGLGSFTSLISSAQMMCAGSTSCSTSGNTTKMGPGTSATASFSFACAGGGCGH